MTIREVCNQLFDLSVGGYFNGEKFTIERLIKQTENMFRGSSPKGGNRVVWQIALPDGWWHFTITKYGNRPDEWGYYIPETREQEKKIIDILN